MATPEPSREDAWGLVPAIPDPPPLDAEIGVTTDSEDWGPITPRKVSTGDMVTVVGLAGLLKLRWLVVSRGWHRRRMH